MCLKDDEELIKSEVDFISDMVEDIEFEGGSKGGGALSTEIKANGEAAEETGTRSSKLEDERGTEVSKTEDDGEAEAPTARL